PRAPGLGDGHRHPPILEGAGGVLALVLQGEVGEAHVPGDPGPSVELRVALRVRPGGDGPGQRQLTEAPDPASLPRPLRVQAPVATLTHRTAGVRGPLPPLEQSAAGALDTRRARGEAAAAGRAAQSRAHLRTRAPCPSTLATWVTAAMPRPRYASSRARATGA